MKRVNTFNDFLRLNACLRDPLAPIKNARTITLPDIFVFRV